MKKVPSKSGSFLLRWNKSTSGCEWESKCIWLFGDVVFGIPTVYNTCLTKVLKENNVSELSLHDCLLNSDWSFSFFHHTLYVFQRFYGLQKWQWLLTDETEWLLAGLVTGSRAPLGVRCQQGGRGVLYGLVLLKLNQFYFNGLKMDSKLTPKPTLKYIFFKHWCRKKVAPSKDKRFYAGQHSFTCIQVLLCMSN